MKRSGPEAMAVDEWLLETATEPMLRVYGWDGDWASVGYFGKISEARTAIPGVSWVRRWTGGGMVDHRADWTYTLVLPHSEKLANERGAESYRRIHAALAEALTAEGVAVRLSVGEEETGAALCFENPVSHDLVGPGGVKLAGAGQRRTRHGLLHQGSAALACGEPISRKRAERLAELLADAWESVDLLPDTAVLAAKTSARYADSRWLEKR
ncbi:MAG: lipoate--protein ligase family protein [Luteolibacter sp.]